MDNKQKNGAVKAIVVVIIILLLCAAAVAAFFLIKNRGRNSQLDSYGEGTVEKRLGDVSFRIPLMWIPTEETMERVVCEPVDKYGNRAYIMAEYKKVDLPRSNTSITADTRDAFDESNNVISVWLESLPVGSIKRVYDARGFTYSDTRNGEAWSYTGYIIPIRGTAVFTYICGVPDSAKYNRYEDDLNYIYDNIIIPADANEDEQAEDVNNLTIKAVDYDLGNSVRLHMENLLDIAHDENQVLAFVRAEDLLVGKYVMAQISEVLRKMELEYCMVSLEIGGEPKFTTILRKGEITSVFWTDEKGEVVYDSTPEWYDESTDDPDVRALILESTDKGMQSVVDFFGN